MSTISDSGVINALRRQMTLSVAKQVASAGNLANVDTPGYKTQEVSTSFGDALAAKLRPVNSTYPSASLPGVSGGSGAMTKDVEGLEARRDGNNVQMDRELLNMNRAAGDFAAAQTALAAKFRLVRYALAENR